MLEEWKPIKGYEGIYEVSNLGRVKRIKESPNRHYGKILKLRDNGHGYLRVGLRDSSKQQHKLIHKLIAEAFIPNPDKKPYIDHIDGDILNNRIDNLRWCSQKENCNNPVSRERYKSAKTGLYGILHPGVKPIICIELGRLFWGVREAERVFMISANRISKVVNGKAKTAGGYHWRYATEEEIKKAKCGSVCNF